MIRKLTPIIILATTYLTLILTFIIAYFNPDKSILVTINSFNEAHLELILLLGTLPTTAKYLLNQYRVVIGNR